MATLNYQRVYDLSSVFHGKKSILYLSSPSSGRNRDQGLGRLWPAENCGASTLLPQWEELPHQAEQDQKRMRRIQNDNSVVKYGYESKPTLCTEQNGWGLWMFIHPNMVIILGFEPHILNVFSKSRRSGKLLTINSRASPLWDRIFQLYKFYKWI